LNELEPVPKVVDDKGDGVREPLAATKGAFAVVHETVRTWLGLLLLALFCLGISLLALPMLALPRALRRRKGRQLISVSARAYLNLLVRMGACRFDLAALDELEGAGPMMIAPNHPSLFDAVIILSRLPDATCIMKADIVNNVLFGGCARLAGYIGTTPLRTMVKGAVENLHEGSHVLLFPEGTRTTRFPLGPLQGTTGLIAKNAGVPVQTVFIETDSGFLGKGWSLLWTPHMPITYRVRLGQRFDAPARTAEFTTALEAYFRSELANALLPEFPIARPRR
jgi:1-acyl-sn-glycerol-3-phosphate acyltransferase